MARDRGPDAVLITDAAPSFSTEQHHRRRRYTILMAIHLVGLALSGVLYYYAWWLGLVLIIISTPLPWVAVILANSPSRPFRRASRASPRPGKPVALTPRAGSRQLPIDASQSRPCGCPKLCTLPVTCPFVRGRWLGMIR
jgi:Protein of unknown function (DUF3099)